MKSRTVRTLIPIIVLVIVGLGFAIGHAGIGNLSAFGWRDIAILCPVGALTSMLAAKIMMPRAIVSLVIVVVLVVLFGRAFCGWVCPVPIVAKTRNVFAGDKKQRKEDAAALEQAHSNAVAATDAVGDGTAVGTAGAAAALTAEEKKLLARGCGGSCAERHGTFDARHLVLGGSLLSAAIFGFPVFCLVCPVGLAFASIFLFIRAFGFGDVSLLFVLVPLFLVLEVVVFRKWCHTFCPISAFMSLVGLANRTFQPKIADSACLETAHGVACGRCGAVCAEGIDPRHPELGNGMNECTRCRECLDVCPSGALSMPFLSKAPSGSGTKTVPVAIAAEDRVAD